MSTACMVAALRVRVRQSGAPTSGGLLFQCAFGDSSSAPQDLEQAATVHLNQECLIVNYLSNLLIPTNVVKQTHRRCGIAFLV